MDKLLHEHVDIESKTNRGMTPLHLAAEHGHPNVANLLIHHGANVNARDSVGRTPLMWAVARGHGYTVYSSPFIEGSKLLQA